ncbi:MAG: hypothetical protein TEF_15255 [Rhizobiales bacterium NRL2]|jgi:hypothetical protein|nr:MAG: hypothetical protein TEF_15255 [Rhizobiales bacterium NRL2]
MMTNGARYAIYFMPEQGGMLARRGASWLGRNALTGETVEQRCPGEIEPAGFVARTQSPSRYGFHATLKAPIRLSPGVSERAFRAAVAEYASRARSFNLGRLSPKWIGAFLALTPDSADPEHMRALNDWAFGIVRTLDPFRAAMPAEEFERRVRGLDDRQRQLLERWGYPYVCDQFRFHMTLSAPVPEAERSAWRAAADRWFAPALARDVAIDAISIAVERNPTGPFVELARYPLGDG